MTIEELKFNLIEEHKRDKKLTIIAFVLIAIVLITVGILIKLYAADKVIEIFNNITQGTDNATAEYSIYYKFIIPIIIVSYLIYPIYRIYTLNKRPQKIDEFVAKLQEGLIAQTVNQTTVYKIIIPLIKINFKLSPVEYIHVFLADDYGLKYNFKGYQFPIPLGTVSDAKAILSGANMQQLNKSWNELYSDGEKEDSELTTLKSQEEFENFLNTDLQPELLELEQGRKKGSKNYVLYFLVIALIMGGWFTLQYLMATQQLVLSPTLLIGGFIGFFGVFYIVFYFVKIKGSVGTMGNTLNHTFKTKIFNRIISFINPSFQYILHGHISNAELLETGIFENKHYEVSGNDQIIGKHNGVAFQLCDLTVERTKSFSNEKEGPDQVFFGQVFIAQFNKSFNTELYLIPKKTGGILKGNDSKDHLNYNLGEKVILEDPEFIKMYDVYSNDQIEARYIMSTALMQRIKDLTLKTKGQFYISFKNNRISVANNSLKNNFETKLFKANDNKLMLNFYTELSNQLSIIDDLKLTLKIWK